MALVHILGWNAPTPPNVVGDYYSRFELQPTSDCIESGAVPIITLQIIAVTTTGKTFKGITITIFTVGEAVRSTCGK